MGKSKTINQYLDILTSKYKVEEIKDEILILYNKLISFKDLYGGKQIIEPSKHCKELIDKYL